MRHSDVIKDLQSVQDSENDTREDSREADHFLEDKNGQWEQRVWNQAEGRPRYTFDKCNHVVDLICGPIEESTFGIKTSPANQNGDQKFAELLNGIIRGIQKESKAQAIYNRSMRRVVRSGFAALKVATEWKPGTFEQRLVVKSIPNAIDKVWIDESSVEPDGSDARYCWELDFIPWSEYNKKFPRAKIKKFSDTKLHSVDDNVQFTRYWYKPEGVTIGTYYYAKPEVKRLALLDNGEVIELKETSVEMIEMQGRSIVRERSENSDVWYSRRFSQGDWLEKEKRTVFKSNPIIPMMGCHEIIENKRLFRGAISKLMDAQRVLNYAKSKEIEEGALQPRDKTWMDKRQAKDKDVRAKLVTMNNNPDPVQFYNHVDGVPPPYKSGPSQINPQLNNLAQTMAQDIEMSAGKYAASLGKNPMNQSGRALEMQIDQSALTDTKWALVLKGAIERVAEVLIEAMPEVYDTQTSLISQGEDGAVSMVEVNKPVMNQNGAVEIENKITADYSVDVSIGPAYGSAAKEANAAILELAAVQPDILAESADIFTSNITAPGMDLIQQRARQRLLNAGAIPVEQMTEEEKEQMTMKAQQQGQQPDPAMVLAQAEMGKAQAEQINAQTKQMSTQIDYMNAETKRIEAMVKAQESGVKVEGMQIDNVGKMLDNQGKQVDNTGKQIDNITKVVQ